MVIKEFNDKDESLIEKTNKEKMQLTENVQMLANELDELNENNRQLNDKIIKDEKLNNIYTIDILEMNLSNMFSQSVIDMYNKFMMSNGLMANSYLKRNFCTNFEFDGYTSFVDMFINNNLLFFEEIDSNVIDYFSKFPDFISNQKPIVRILTNYSEL